MRSYPGRQRPTSALLMLRGGWKLFNCTATACDLGLWLSTGCCLYCTTPGYKELASACLGAGITELHHHLHLYIKIYRDVLGQYLHLYELQSVEWISVFPGTTRCFFSMQIAKRAQDIIIQIAITVLLGSLCIST